MPSTVSFAARLPPKLHKQVKAYAKKNHASMNKIIILALTGLVDKQGPLTRIEQTVVQTDKKVDKLLEK